MERSSVIPIAPAALPKTSSSSATRPPTSTVEWGPVNQPIRPDTVRRPLRDGSWISARAQNFYVQDLFCGADPDYRLPIRVINEYAWHNLFVRQLFIRPTPSELNRHAAGIHHRLRPGVPVDPKRDGTNSEVFVMLNFTRRIVLIGGTSYAGEMKKSRLHDHELPAAGAQRLPHALLGEHRAATAMCALFFGLSGTGKTTLSADPDARPDRRRRARLERRRRLQLRRRLLRQVHPALARRTSRRSGTRFASARVLENVVIDSETRILDFDDDSKTENTRAAYPLDFIDNAVIPSVGGHPKNVIFLTADAFGVLPPISKLTPEQAMYHFLSGYTAKVAGTEPA